MLLEDPKNPHNPKIRINANRKQVNLLSPKEQKILKGHRQARTIRAIGAHAGGWLISPKISDALLNPLIDRDIARREKKLDKKEREEHMHRYMRDIREAATSTAQKKGSLWTRANTWTAGKISQAKQYNLDHPITGALTAVGGAAALQGIVGAIGGYMSHKAQMASNPLYAQQVYDAKRAKKERTGSFAPDRLGQEQDPSQAMGMNRPILPSHAQNNQKAPAQNDRINNDPDEARPKSSVAKKQQGPQLYNAQIAVSKHMDPEAVNRVGMSIDQSKFKLNTATKTNTRKEDIMVSDRLMETVDNIYEFDIHAAWKNFKPQAEHAWKTLKKSASNTWKNVKPHATAAWDAAKRRVKAVGMEGRGGETYRRQATQDLKNAVKGAKEGFMKKSESLEDIIDNIYEIAPVAAAGAIGARAVLGGIGRLAMGVVKKHAGSMAKQAVIDGGLSYAGTKIKRAFSGESLDDTINNMYEGFFGTMYRGAVGAPGSFARKKAAALLGKTAAVGVAGGIGQSIGNRLGNIGAKRPVAESIGAGALSGFELNPYKQMKDVNQYQRNQWISATQGKVRRSPRHFNSPRKRATDDPIPGAVKEMLRSRAAHITETSLQNNLSQIGSNIEAGVGKAVKGTVKGAAKGVGHWAKWAASGHTGKKLLYTAAALYGAKKVKDVVTGNKKYLQRKADRHREAYNDAMDRLQYKQDKEELRSRRRF
jgi:hypothetical protein